MTVPCCGLEDQCFEFRIRDVNLRSEIQDFRSRTMGELARMWTNQSRFRWATVVLAGIASIPTAGRADEAPPGSAPPQESATANQVERSFVSIEAYPTDLVISSVRDERRVLVTGVTADGQRIDVSGKAVFSTASKQV